MRRNRIIHVEGPDRCGKSEIALALSLLTGIPMYKNPIESELYETNGTRDFVKVLRYCSPVELHFAKLYGDVIFDRNFISEYVYAKMYNRPTDLELIEKLDREYSKLGAVVIFCYKTGYNGSYNDEHIPESDMDAIRFFYKDYLTRKSGMRVLYLDTTNEDLDSQLRKIVGFLRDVERIDTTWN